MVADLVRLLDHLKVGETAVVGYSMGAEIGLRLLVDHPQAGRITRHRRVGLVRVSGRCRPCGLVGVRFAFVADPQHMSDVPGAIGIDSHECLGVTATA